MSDKSQFDPKIKSFVLKILFILFICDPIWKCERVIIFRKVSFWMKLKTDIQQHQNIVLLVTYANWTKREKKTACQLLKLNKWLIWAAYFWYHQFCNNIVLANKHVYIIHKNILRPSWLKALWCYFNFKFHLKRLISFS